VDSVIEKVYCRSVRSKRLKRIVQKEVGKRLKKTRRKCVGVKVKMTVKFIRV
jgi:hypothetical protein